MYTFLNCNEYYSEINTFKFKQKEKTKKKSDNKMKILLNLVTFNQLLKI